MNEENTPEIPNQTKTLPKLQQKTIDAMRMVQAGLTPREALQYANVTDHISGEAVSKFKAKLKKYSLLAPDIAKLAHHQVRRILKGRAREVVQEKVTKAGEVVKITEQIIPTDSNILAAAAMVYDRYEPVQAAEQGSGQTINYLDFSSYQVAVNPPPCK